MNSILGYLASQEVIHVLVNWGDHPHTKDGESIECNN